MLGEMVARAVKGIIRTQLRDYCKVAKGVSLHFKTGVTVNRAFHLILSLTLT